MNEIYANRRQTFRVGELSQLVLACKRALDAAKEAAQEVAARQPRPVTAVRAASQLAQAWGR